jgi:hypothetical protein
MDDWAFDELPRAYRLGLSLRALGADDELIARWLDIDPDGVATLLEIGARKLERLQQARRLGHTTEAGTTVGRVGSAVESEEGREISTQY